MQIAMSYVSIMSNRMTSESSLATRKTSTVNNGKLYACFSNIHWILPYENMITELNLLNILEVHLFYFKCIHFILSAFILCAF